MVGNNTVQIPGFSDLTEVGSGGFGTVYAATEDFTDRRVAVKVLKQGLDASDQRRFERECQTMARLSDQPNVVTLYSAGFTDDDRPFIVMELLAGGSLAERLEENGPLDWRQVQHIGLKMADALVQAHEAGVLHRDIKPANILMVGDEPKLSDFGIASFLDSTTATSTNISVSLQHAPPETFDNIRDERSDLYSLGSTLYALLTGSAPFLRVGENSVNPLLNRILNEEPQPIARPDVPPALRSLVLEMLRKDPNERPQTAALLRERLDGISESLASTSDTVQVPPIPGSALPGDGEQTDSTAVYSPGATAPTPSNGQSPNSNPPNGRRNRRRGVIFGGVAIIACIAVVGFGLSLLDRSDNQATEGQRSETPVGDPLAGSRTADVASGDSLSDSELPTSSASSTTDQTDEAPPSTTIAPETSTAVSAADPLAGPTTTLSAPTSTVPTTPAPTTASPSTTVATSQSLSSATNTTLAPAPGATMSSDFNNGQVFAQFFDAPTGGAYRYRLTINGVEVDAGTTDSTIRYELGSQTGRICAYGAILSGGVVTSLEGSVCRSHEPTSPPAKPTLRSSIGLNSLAASFYVDGASTYTWRVTIDGVQVREVNTSNSFANHQNGESWAGEICLYVLAIDRFGKSSPEAVHCEVQPN